MQPLGREIEEVIKTDAETGKYKKYKMQGKQHGATDEQIAEQEAKAKEPNCKKISRVALPRVTVPSCCKVCDGPLTIGGPIWNQPIHNVEFAKRLIKVVRK